MNRSAYYPHWGLRRPTGDWRSAGDPRRIFVNNISPPLFERITMESTDHRVTIVWTGKRWYCPQDSDGSVQTHEAWPPHDYGPGPWIEVPLKEER